MDDQGLPPGFFARPPVVVARALLGVRLLVGGVGGIIVETEAYDRDDPASHSFRGPTRRNRAMFGPPGRAYVYRSYGIHWCFNIVCGAAATGAAVLIRAIEPTHGVAVMQERRRNTAPRLLSSGPGRLTEALGIGGGHDGADLAAPPFVLAVAVEPAAIATGPRIGISRGLDRPWRFAVADSPFLSRPMTAATGADSAAAGAG